VSGLRAVFPGWTRRLRIMEHGSLQHDLGDRDRVEIYRPRSRSEGLRRVRAGKKLREG